MKNIASLVEVLEKLGFDASLHTTLHTYISLQLPKFSISYKAVKERDVIKFNLFFQRKDDRYSCLYYDATLRKEITVPQIVVDGIQLKDLDDRMSLISWKDLFDKEQDIASIINDLQILQLSREGKDFSEELKTKHWLDTPLESLMKITILKPKYEITQRFYFPANGLAISVDEAYRFLTNKWMERQLRKKPIVNPLPISSKPKSKKSKSSKT